jgi:hypothetical protein
MKGGKPFLSVLDEESFIQQYPTIQGTTSIEKLLTLYPTYDNSVPLNVLIGCGNMYDSDWFRYENNETYSIFIDSVENYEGIRTSDLLDTRKQYKMFTVFYEEMVTDLIPQNIVTHYHFDLMVAYFCNRNEYMKLFDRTLRPGGSIVFNRLEHSGALQFFTVTNSVVQFLSQQMTTLPPGHVMHNLSKYFIFDTINKGITLKDDTSDEFFLLHSHLLSAELGFRFIEIERSAGKMNFVPYENDISLAYHNFLNITYGINYNISKKSFNYQEYSYPVPMQVKPDTTNSRGKIVEIWNSPCAKFIINNVMTNEEFENYVKYGRLDQGLIDSLITKVIQSPQLQQEYVQKVSPKSESYVESEFVESFLSEIFKDYEYYEFTKR